MGDVKAKVLFVITRLASGGAPQSTVEMLSILKNNGYDVHLVTGLAGEDERRPANDLRFSMEELKAEGVEIVVIPHLVRNIRPLQDLAALVKLVFLIHKFKVDVVHTHTSKAGILGRLAAQLAGVRVILHSPHGHVLYGYFHPWLTKFFIFLEKISACWSTAIITLTQKEISEYLELGIGAREIYRCIYNGIETECYAQPLVDKEIRRQKMGIPPQAIVLTSVGRLVPVKGHRYLLEAMKILIASLQFGDGEHLRCLIAGDGELRGELENTANELGISKYVFFLGHRQDIPEILLLSDVFVFPSLNEGFGLAVVEAMAAGLPVVASRVGGLPEVVREGETGFLVPPGDGQVLANTIGRLLNDQQLRSRMGEAGRQRARASFSREKMSADVLSLYEEVLKK